MIANFQRTIITTLSGMAGGLGKTLSITPLQITFSESVEIAFFATLSALIGYIVKCLLDRLVSSYRKSKQHRIRKTRNLRKP